MPKTGTILATNGGGSELLKEILLDQRVSTVLRRYSNK
ncbi:hypothetical protein V202x_42760 [Gimesia aquarii]|uniref:Uncharacterized protein n=1 Tax=Gimesia aquarii TaxID=2527964 RepID=A0A517X035_9PLAN|nr:hypothetical protein V202x_42760 [Gimesia aquarii]